MTTQLTAVRLTASGQVTLGPSRIRDISVLGGAAVGTLTFIDGSTNGSGGTTVAVIDVGAGSGGATVIKLSGLGLRFKTNIYCTFGSTAPAGATIFFG